ncbi:hypothetical protein H4582DRAFT_2056175 [Lactarius indigo]|nr:hypothetical protein H4582DRAFT_2056175 [Lactarius indigo]
MVSQYLLHLPALMGFRLLLTSYYGNSNNCILGILNVIAEAPSSLPPMFFEGGDAMCSSPRHMTPRPYVRPAHSGPKLSFQTCDILPKHLIFHLLTPAFPPPDSCQGFTKESEPFTLVQKASLFNCGLLTIGTLSVKVPDADKNIGSDASANIWIRGEEARRKQCEAQTEIAISHFPKLMTSEMCATYTGYMQAGTLRVQDLLSVLDVFTAIEFQMARMFPHEYYTRDQIEGIVPVSSGVKNLPNATLWACANRKNTSLRSVYETNAERTDTSWAPVLRPF